ncbi:hypothetical protein GCM10010912_12810 [Paenibacillus albidus]|uniref:TPM domain-containing protein n=1 Tax=Paenibacillus albidus TaxID=2041023 RepID=A0A917C3L1_9BACL|nr:TPM domain-containing protein [Paenibacillus albidus]GGF69132.1 hypothetical protein GCM10010912_12810 [Paenibacillus albidus]
MIHKTLKTMLAALLLSVWIPTFGLASSSLPKHNSSFYVNDFADVIDLKSENFMVNYGVQLHKKTGAQVVVVTVDSTHGTSLKEYATSLFNKWGVGSAEKNNGVLVLLSIQDDDYWAVQGKGIENTLTDAKMGQILSTYLEPDFAAKGYSNGARKTYGAFIQFFGGTWNESLNASSVVADNAGVFKKVTIDYLNQSASRYHATAGSRVYIVTVKNIGDQTLQEYTYKKFASAGARAQDVMLVLDIGGSNYHVLQGKNIDKVLTNNKIKGILDTALEPLFAAKDYSGGAVAVTNVFYEFFLSRADNGVAVSAVPNPHEVADYSGVLIFGFVIFVILVVLGAIRTVKRNRNLSEYGLAYNPYSRRNVRRYGAWTRGHGYWYGEQWNYYPQQMTYVGNTGGGGASSEGGAGRYYGGDSNHGGGGSSSGGGAGRYSSDDNDNDDYSSSGDGGSASSGGGVGRH